MSELPKKVVAPTDSGATAATSVAKPVAETPVQPVAVVAPVGEPPAAFGGHRGGGKKRADGLVAGSPEAKAADLQKDRDRKNAANAAKKLATRPPPLPSLAAPGTNPPAPLAAGATGLPAPVAGAVVPALSVEFVAWSEKILSRPVKLFTKICDRVRVAARMRRVKKLSLEPAQEKEIERDLHFKADALEDFNAALANCATVELNKRRVAGAANSHWLDLLMTGGELISTDMAVADKIEKMILENEAKKKEAVELAQN